MIQEEKDENLNLPLYRPSLKRSKTISVVEIDPCTLKTGLDNKLRDADAVKEVPREEPKSSCQALRHAVSSLTRIDDFLLEELGSGFFANVYKATHNATNQEMVMKINKDIANRHCALREVQLMNKMAHPNILRFLGVCVHEGQLHSLTEYISGGNLEDLLANEAEELPWTLRIKLSLDIARGLSYVHQLGYIHRDLTSRNVLIKKGENKYHTAVIADFGLATKIPDPQSSPLVPVGSPWWIAPEVIKAKFYDERADLFSFGIINMELTARIESDPDIMPRTNNFGVDYHQICELVEYCPLDFLQLAFKCCQVQPERRPSAKDCVMSLEKIYTNLNTDPLTQLGKGHKRSKSEDNILQCNESFNEDDLFMTAKCVAQVMSADDPDYSPAMVNPFAGFSQLRYGHKLVDFHPRKVSLTSPSHRGGLPDPYSAFVFPDVEKPESLSLPSSPLMLRKAAEKMHQISLHGSDAIKPENRNELQVNLCNDLEISKDTSAADRQAQFRNSRTRSLGSLDFYGPKGMGALPTTQSESKGYCNISKEILRESSYEDILGCEADSESEDTVTASTATERHLMRKCPSPTSESNSTAVSGWGAEEDDSADNTDASLSSCSATSCTSLDRGIEPPAKCVLGEEKGSALCGEDKPLVAIETGNFESNHF